MSFLVIINVTCQVCMTFFFGALVGCSISILEELMEIKTIIKERNTKKWISVFPPSNEDETDSILTDSEEE